MTKVGVSEWSEDAAFWEAMEPALCASARLSLAEGDVAAIVGLVRPPAGARVLDMACGPGAHALAFARRGHRVTGVDRSRRLLDRARSAAGREAVQVEWVEADMRAFRRPASFDLVCSLYTSFGYFDDRQNRRVLENARADLAPNGVFLIDVIGREVAARQWPERRRYEVDGVVYLERSESAEHGSARVSDWVVTRGEASAEFRVRQRLYTGPELRELLLSVGFDSVQLYGSLGGESEYDESARRLVAVAGRRDLQGRVHRAR